MRLHIRGLTSVFTALTVLRTITHSVSALVNVSVQCDSNGVVVDWMPTGLSEQAEFLLNLIPNYGENVYVSTKSPRYNISDLLLDTAYNYYYVSVKARDGGRESEFAESPTFSYNFMLTQASVVCELEFPTVRLFPRDGELFISFSNPLHLYRDTPALRNLKESHPLQYTVTSGKISEEFTCFLKTNECESNISFPEKQEQYCVTLTGRIRQTRVRRTQSYCYQGTLNPGPPLSTYLIPALVAFTVIPAVLFGAVLLLKACDKKITMKKSLSRMPAFLKFPVLSTTTPLKMDPDHVTKNLTIELVIETPPDGAAHLPEHPDDLKYPGACGKLTDYTEDEDMTQCSSEASLLQEGLDAYGHGSDLSSGSTFTGYDRRHTHLEMSPGDMVKNYGRR